MRERMIGILTPEIVALEAERDRYRDALKTMLGCVRAIQRGPLLNVSSDATPEERREASRLWAELQTAAMDATDALEKGAEG